MTAATMSDVAAGHDLPGFAPIEFRLPADLEASEPPESRGIARDETRLLVSHYRDNRIEHLRFREIGSALSAGDLLVFNTSATIKAALRGRRHTGEELRVHLSTHLGEGLWTLELRAPSNTGSKPFRSALPGDLIELHGDARALLLDHYNGSPRLWLARLELGMPDHNYIDRYGFPIRYGHVLKDWPLEAYQTVFASEPGSAEMPSAGRGFTAELVVWLLAKGIQFAPILLHTGVSSMEDHEPPISELFRVPAATAREVNSARAAGSRVIAVGTTVARALETMADARGGVREGDGWTDLVITPSRGIRAIDGLITGFHEPRSTHLAILQAFAGRDHIEQVYRESLSRRYLWHEFGDFHLLIP